MPLTEYQRKRRFDRTPEPRGRVQAGAGPLRFVVHKHAASRLHYDFRLELDGVLVSWAVPKGPSLDPRDKRLAIRVEDHPLDYRTFEGTIPKGSYGAGTVMVWDQGVYSHAGEADPARARRLLKAGLAQGRLDLVLVGEKLQGEFHLVRTPGVEDNAWLLMKAKGEGASDRDVAARDRSVLTGRTLDQIAAGAAPADPPPIAPGPAAPLAAAAGPVRPRAARTRAPEPPDAQQPPGDLPGALGRTPRGALPSPEDLKPMLATLVDEPFDRSGWVFEVKWDGYRMLAWVTPGTTRLVSRGGKDCTGVYPPVAADLRRLGRAAVLDGELVVLDRNGRPDFGALQRYPETGAGELAYMVFDLLHLDGRDLTRLPLRERRGLLRPLLRGLPSVRFSEDTPDAGRAFFQAAAALGLEGMVAKDGDGPYLAGRRTRHWLKVKTHGRQEAVIGGWTEGRGGRRHLGALVLGVYRDGALHCIGHTGGGFDDRGLAAMAARLAPLERPDTPFAGRFKTNAPVHWVDPELVCEVKFQEWTDDGHLRQPIFLGLREDRDPRSVVREAPAPAEGPDGAGAVPPAPGGATAPRKASATRKAPAARETDPAPAPGPPGGFRITHPDKVLWPGEGFTKADLARYYEAVAPWILPCLRDRPESLDRHPNGIARPGFFQKNVETHPDWVRTVPLRSGSGGRDIACLVCDDLDTLLYMANLGCIELNPWHSRTASLDRPDYLLLDLDAKTADFPAIVQVALEARRLLEELGLPSVPKTSGKTGLHLCLPLGARYDYDQARQFAELLMNLLQRRLPDRTSVVRDPDRRTGLVYLDFLQNRRGQTMAAPYCVRPVPGAPVSTPLDWSEVKPGLDPAAFNLRTAPDRFRAVGDLWAPVLGPGLDLGAALAAIGSAAGLTMEDIRAEARTVRRVRAARKAR